MQVRAALLRNDWSEVGRLVREEWAFRRRNLATISTPVIDRIIAGARKQGALGGKVCGAGGGGCVALLIEPDARQRVEAVIVAAGGTVLPLADRPARRAREGDQIAVSSPRLTSPPRSGRHLRVQTALARCLGYVFGTTSKFCNCTVTQHV